MSTRLQLFAVLILSFPAAAAQAQWGYSYHSSTLEEGVQRGAADFVRSQGMANLSNAQAATQFEQARNQYLDNQMKATQTYFEMRRYNTEARRAASSTPLSMEQYVRLARDQAPDSLTATQLDSLTGAVHWPQLLQAPAYEQGRRQIDKLFQERAAGYAVSGDIQQACKQLEAQLKADIEKYPAKEYMNSKKFLDSLSYASQNVQT